ncbi:MAG TPA: histidine phosphatase family protein [Gammaproteobacteria bacterium]|nr:histidine phosphatase family protein [Gammaproteobacteria bacterium]
MKIFALRHGHTNYNQLGLCNGDPTVDVHLTSTGIGQAEAAAEVLKEEPLEHIFVSQLPRTRETAIIINRFHGVGIESHPGLNDIVTGCEGQPVSVYLSKIAKDRLRTRPDNGESLLDYKARVLGFVESLNGLSFHTVALVAHEETLRILYGHFRGLKDEALASLNFRNCQILLFEI